jgi:class 3 adenylate cyclase
MADEAGKAVDFARSDGQVTALALTDRLVETERRLAAILAMDVVGYSRMVEADEDLALARLRWLRESLLEPQIAGHRGRIFKTMGDGLLAEFASASDAIGAAVDIQRVLTTATLDGGMCGPLQVRIGIHIGDVVSDGRPARRHRPARYHLCQPDRP